MFKHFADTHVRVPQQVVSQRLEVVDAVGSFHFVFEDSFVGIKPLELLHMLRPFSHHFSFPCPL